MISSVFRKIFGTKNDREVKKYVRRVAHINALEPTYEKMSDDELKIKFNKLKAQVVEEKVTLDEILNDVLKHLNISFDKSSSIINREDILIERVFEDIIKDIDENDVAKLIKDLNISVINYKTPAIMLAIQTAIKAGGFASYKITVIVANYIAKLILKRGLTLTANAMLTKGLWLLIGPIGMAVTGIWTITDIVSGPAMRVTVPACVIIAYLRETIMLEKENK